MKKIISVLLILLMMCSCAKQPEPIAFGTKLYIDVKEDSEIESVNDLKDKVIAYQIRINEDENQYVIDELKKLKIFDEQLLLFDSYRDLPNMIDNNEIDAWIISDNTYVLLKDYYNDFDDSTYIHIAEYEMPIYEEEPLDEVIVNDDLYTKPFAVMLTGIDQRVNPDQNGKALNDVNLMMVVDPIHNHILTVSFPRDSYLYSPTLGHSRKMTEIGPIANDVNAIKEAVANLFDIDIPYYVQTSFSGFVDMITHFGGVWVDVPMDTMMDMDSNRDVTKPYKLEKGYTKLYGEWALALARNRKYNGIYGGDYGRIRNQCLLVNGLINKILTYPEILEWAHIDWYAKYIAAFNFTDEQLNVLFALADKFHNEGYTFDNYFIENIGGMTDYGASIGYVTDHSKEIAKGKINLALTGELAEDNVYYDDILLGNVTGGANQEGYIRNEYDLREVYFSNDDGESEVEDGLEEVDTDNQTETDANE